MPLGAVVVGPVCRGGVPATGRLSTGEYAERRCLETRGRTRDEEGEEEGGIAPTVLEEAAGLFMTVLYNGSPPAVDEGRGWVLK